MIKAGIDIAKGLLEGVGQRRMAFTTDPPGCAIHVQAPLTAGEIYQLPEGWMDIPAVDELGPCRMLKVDCAE